MKRQYSVLLLLAAILIVAFAAIAGSGRVGNSDIPAPPAIGAVIDEDVAALRELYEDALPGRLGRS